MKTAQNEAAIPINPTKLSPVNKLSKSSSVMLKTIRARAKIINIEVKIFIIKVLLCSEITIFLFKRTTL